MQSQHPGAHTDSAQRGSESAGDLTTPLRARHLPSGARFGRWFGVQLPDAFPDAAAEYRFARESVALFDTNFRSVFFLAGPDRVRYLNAISSGDIQSLTDGAGALGLLLNPQGHILAELESYALPDCLLVLSHAVVRQRTAAWLEKYIIMDDVTLDDATDRFASFHLAGPRLPDILRDLAGLDFAAMGEFAHAEAHLGLAACRVLRRSLTGAPGAELLLPREHAADLWELLADAARARSGGPAGYAAFNALRLEAGLPWFHHDFDDRFIPHEAALESTHISFTKGCYTGQEIVERVRSRGQVNRRRAGLAFSGSEPPAPGTKLLDAGKEAGHVTSSAFSPALGRPIGMGFVRREPNSPGVTLEYASGTATLIELPLAR